MEQALVVLKKELGRGGALCKEYQRTRLMEGMNWRVEMHYALAAIEKSDQLKRCTSDSVGRALIDLGTMGLSLSPAKKEAYLVPYSVRLAGGKFEDRCTVTVSYMGMEQIAYRTGFVEMIQTVLVRKGDKFKVWTDQTGRNIEHTEAIYPATRGEVIFAYCIAWFSSGKKHIEVMDKKELLACRDAAARKNNNQIPFTWKGDFRGEMYKKAVLRRGWKHWPRTDNPRLVAMMESVNRTDPMEFKETDSVVEESPTLDQDQIDVLIEIMEQGGIPDRGHDSWLQGLAKGLGYPDGIRHVLKTDFDKAEMGMKEGLAKWKQSHTSTESGSAQDTSTAQPEAA